MVLAPFAPAATLRLAGLAESVKLGGAPTVIAIVVLLAIVPALPVTVKVEVPGAAFAATLNISVVVRVVVAALKVAVMPAGSPATEKVTKPLKLPSGDTVTALVPLPPWETLMLAGDAAIE
jgi:hypothetical protein